MVSDTRNFRFFPNMLAKGLNPCFSGRWSLTRWGAWFEGQVNKSLNPCFSGRWSLTTKELKEELCDYSLNPCFSGRWSLTLFIIMTNEVNAVVVLILV